LPIGNTLLLLAVDQCAPPDFRRKMSIAENVDNEDIELLMDKPKNYKEIRDIADENVRDRTKKRSDCINNCPVFFPSFAEKYDEEKNDILLCKYIIHIYW